MMNNVYKVLTPAGHFDAIFAEDEDITIEYSGDELAISFFKDWLFINQISGSQGYLLDSDKLTPADLYGFCQPLNSGIEVIPPFDDFMSYTQEDIAMQTDKAVAESKILDGVYSDADKKSIAATNQLIKFFREFIASDFEKAQVPTAIYGWTATAQVMDKEDAKRRLRELIDIAINRKAGMEDITPKKKQRLDDYRHDARVISDYLTKRIRHTGARNLLRVPEMKKKYPYIDNQPREGFDSIESDSNDRATLDAAISGTQKLKLVKELRDIRAGITSATSGIEKLKMVKRVNEIRKALGVKVTANNDNQVEKAGNNIDDVNAVMPLLKRFIGEAQFSAVMSGIRGEEGQFFIDKMIEIANTIQNMPQTYGQDGMDDKAIAYLHYFKGSGDWYITEKDMEDEQIQAFGLADIFGDMGELGYINIEEIIQHGVELDFYWTPKTLGQIEHADSEDETQGTQAGDESSEINDPAEMTQTPEDASPEDNAKSGFISELESLKAETDINRFNERLDEIAARIEQAGLMESLDKELNDAADVLTALLSAAESGGK
ncbi:MAG: DUF2958 domain-containing protein [Nitrosomonas sp.]|uniref:DUF2958 domain-containing protein n=1 Tax=Nitrosomonas sp. TaxID=42353 RepID=UPI0025E3B9C1|nr:DUF2958 domain-containing protein [Nitrosomonas sp.]MBY0475383.1 DUF2958 domain-containing protein [Nitrosomonas sp.]